MSVTTIVVPSPLKIIHSQTEQELSGKSLPQLPAIIQNSCNWKLPFSILVYCKTEPLFHFLICQLSMQLCPASVFPHLSLRLNPNYCLTSWSQSPTNHLKFFYNDGNQAWNQTWEKLASFTCNYFAGELEFHHWNVQTILTLPLRKYLHKAGKEEWIPTPVASMPQNAHYKNTTVTALKMLVINNEEEQPHFFINYTALSNNARAVVNPAV